MHQYLTFIGDFPIRFYGIFFSLGILSGCITAYFLLKKKVGGGPKWTRTTDLTIISRAL